MQDKIRITLTLEELARLQHILWHFTDFMAYDDRPDHGLGILKQYRELTDKDKSIIFYLAGKLRRIHRKKNHESLKIRQETAIDKTV